MQNPQQQALHPTEINGEHPIHFCTARLDPWYINESLGSHLKQVIFYRQNHTTSHYRLNFQNNTIRCYCRGKRRYLHKRRPRHRQMRNLPAWCLGEHSEKPARAPLCQQRARRDGEHAVMVCRDTAHSPREVWKLPLPASLPVKSPTMWCEANRLQTRAQRAVQKHDRCSGSCRGVAVNFHAAVFKQTRLQMHPS